MAPLLQATKFGRETAHSGCGINQSKTHLSLLAVVAEPSREYGIGEPSHGDVGPSLGHHPLLVHTLIGWSEKASSMVLPPR